MSYGNVNGNNSNRETGTVKWFKDDKGYGFITRDNNGEDAFVHHTEINMRGRRTLQLGQKVEFDVVQGPKGPKAENVTVL